MRNQTALASWRVRFGEAELALEQAGAAAGVDQPARLGRVALRRRARQTMRCGAAALGQRDVAAPGAPSTKRDAAAPRLLAEEVLEDAAVDLVARHREVAAGADLGHRVDVAPAFAREEAEAELLAAARSSHVRLQAEHLAK